MHTIRLKPGREKTARQRHPWVFSGALAASPRKIAPGEIVRVTDSKGGFVAYGYFNPRSQIRIRLLEWDEGAKIDRDWWAARIRDSVAARDTVLGDDTDACRLIFGESDLLPGLIVDRYGPFLVLQASTAGIERVKDDIIAILEELLHPEGVYERSEGESRNLEGLALSSGVLWGTAPPNGLIVRENGLRFRVDIAGGQKTAFYIDQRENRKIVSSFAAGRDILDCFCYSGAFSIYALSVGARSATLVDSSAHGLAIAKENLNLNGLDGKNHEIIEDDVFRALRRFRGTGRAFDMVILDPPKFAPNKASLKKALLAYKDINMLGMQLLRPGGFLATFSCSGAVDSQTLQTVLFWAGEDAGRRVQIIHSLSQASDHPRLVTFPESEYLKGFICRVL